MSSPVIASRTVDEALHEQFASLSGDRNPIHMDVLAARRTQAGSPVVHGVHTLLWSLESLFAAGRVVTPISRIRVRFLKWVYLGDEAMLSLPNGEAIDPTALQVEVKKLPVCAVDITYGTPGAPKDGVTRMAPVAARATAVELSFGDLDELSGAAFVAAEDDAARLFPHLAEALGAAAVAEIASCSYIVGMEAPGLHSMFSKLDVTLVAKGLQPSGHALPYAVTYHDVRFSKARITVAGVGVTGTLEVFMRDRPAQQASIESVSSRVRAGEFAGVRALVIGGSRGLGELMAKMIAAGGGSVTVSYALGKVEAEQLVEQITRWGGRAQALKYDVNVPPGGQIDGLPELPTHLFYFATGTIYRPKTELLSESSLTTFLRFYVQGFYALCMKLMERKAAGGEGRLNVFYPSTVFLEERPAGMTEYAMVKAAGEQLCRDMNTYLPDIHVVAPRLPKLPTDQTAGVLPERQLDTVDTLLPLLRDFAQAGS